MIEALRFVDRHGKKRLQMRRPHNGIYASDWEDVPYVSAELEQLHERHSKGLEAGEGESAGTAPTPDDGNI